VNISCRGTEEKLHIIGLMTMIRVKGHMHHELKLDKLLVCFKWELWNIFLFAVSA